MEWPSPFAPRRLGRRALRSGSRVLGSFERLATSAPIFSMLGGAWYGTFPPVERVLARPVSPVVWRRGAVSRAKPAARCLQRERHDRACEEAAEPDRRPLQQSVPEQHQLQRWSEQGHAGHPQHPAGDSDPYHRELECYHPHHPAAGLEPIPPVGAECPVRPGAD
jgi:hypothetical protein